MRTNKHLLLTYDSTSVLERLRRTDLLILDSKFCIRGYGQGNDLYFSQCFKPFCFSWYLRITEYLKSAWMKFKIWWQFSLEHITFTITLLEGNHLPTYCSCFQNFLFVIKLQYDSCHNDKIYYIATLSKYFTYQTDLAKTNSQN